MEYEQAALIALEGATRDGMARYVFFAGIVDKDGKEEWRVALHLPGTRRCAVILPQMRAIPDKPGPAL